MLAADFYAYYVDYAAGICYLVLYSLTVILIFTMQQG